MTEPPTDQKCGHCEGQHSTWECTAVIEHTHTCRDCNGTIICLTTEANCDWEGGSAGCTSCHGPNVDELADAEDQSHIDAIEERRFT